MRRREALIREEDREAFRRGPSDSPLASTPISQQQTQTFIASQRGLIVEMPSMSERGSQRRAASAGPMVQQANPFWSERAHEELALQQARPSTLPEMQDDHESSIAARLRTSHQSIEHQMLDNQLSLPPHPDGVPVVFGPRLALQEAPRGATMMTGPEPSADSASAGAVEVEGSVHAPEQRQSESSGTSEFVRAAFNEIRSVLTAFSNRLERLEEVSARTASEGSQGCRETCGASYRGGLGAGPLEVGSYGGHGGLGANGSSQRFQGGLPNLQWILPSAEERSEPRVLLTAVESPVLDPMMAPRGDAQQSMPGELRDLHESVVESLDAPVTAPDVRLARPGWANEPELRGNTSWSRALEVLRERGVQQTPNYFIGDGPCPVGMTVGAGRACEAVGHVGSSVHVQNSEGFGQSARDTTQARDIAPPPGIGGPERPLGSYDLFGPPGPSPSPGETGRQEPSHNAVRSSALPPTQTRYVTPPRGPERLPVDVQYSPQWQRWTELPNLPELDPSEGPLQMHDWLVQLGPLVSDMSSGAMYYWREVLSQAQSFYERWLNLSPLERSQLQVSLSAELCETRFVRVEQRLVGMILKAFPESLKQECIAGGLMSSVQLLWRALVRYQPGGAQERQLLLGYLTGPPKAKSVEDAVQVLRRYSRWGIRSQALGITRPDPSLMLRGLESSVWPVISPHPEATFRLQILKVQLGLDHVPTWDKVSTYLRHLAAECELLAVGAAAEAGGQNKKQRVNQLNVPSGNAETAVGREGFGDNPKGKGKAKGKEGVGKGLGDGNHRGRDPVKGDGKDVGNSKGVTKGVCKHFSTPGGCRRGGTCTDMHPFIPRGESRCYNCGASNHVKRSECPYPGRPEPPGGRGGAQQVAALQGNTSSAGNGSLRGASVPAPPPANAGGVSAASTPVVQHGVSQAETFVQEAQQLLKNFRLAALRVPASVNPASSCEKRHFPDPGFGAEKGGLERGSEKGCFPDPGFGAEKGGLERGSEKGCFPDPGFGAEKGGLERGSEKGCFPDPGFGAEKGGLESESGQGLRACEGERLFESEGECWLEGESVNDSSRRGQSERIDRFEFRCSLKAVGRDADKGGWILLDGGATAPLRPGTARELARAEQVEVGLASGSTRLWLAENGTLLGPADTCPIVPLGELVGLLSCTVSWSRGGCQIRHPKRGMLPTRIRDSCPEVPRDLGFALISELEQVKARKLSKGFRLLRLLASKPAEETLSSCAVGVAKAIQTSGGDLGDSVLQEALARWVENAYSIDPKWVPHIVPDSPDISTVHLNRRRRRAIERSEGVVLNFGQHTAAQPQMGSEVLDVGREVGSILQDGVFDYLCFLAVKGCALSVVGLCEGDLTLREDMESKEEGRAVQLLRQRLVGDLIRFVRGAQHWDEEVWGLGEGVESSVRPSPQPQVCAKLGLQADAFRRHVLQGHVPFDRHCRECLMGAARQRPHRRSKVQHAHVLSVDVGGPYVQSSDGFQGVKWLLVGVYYGMRVPHSDESDGKPDDLQFSGAAPSALKEGDEGMDAGEVEAMDSF